MFWEIFLTWLGTTLFSLLVCIFLNWDELHTLGDFFLPLNSEERSDSIVLYIPGINLVVTAVLLTGLVCYLFEEFFKKEKVRKFFSPIRKFFEIKIK